MNLSNRKDEIKRNILIDNVELGALGLEPNKKMRVKINAHVLGAIKGRLQRLKENYGASYSVEVQGNYITIIRNE